MVSPLLVGGILAGTTVAACALALWHANALERARKPWTLLQREPTRATIAGDRVTLTGVRVARHPAGKPAVITTASRELDFRRLEGVALAVEPIGGYGLFAHTFAVFTFPRETVVISVEARRREGESFRPVRGLFNYYDLVVLAMDAEDAFTLRATRGEHALRLHPLTLTPEERRRFLTELLGEMERVATGPVRYHTLGRNCTNVLVRAFRRAVPGRFPRSWRTVLTGCIDEHLVASGLTPDPAPGDLREVRDVRARIVAAKPGTVNALVADLVRNVSVASGAAPAFSRRASAARPSRARSRAKPVRRR